MKKNSQKAAKGVKAMETLEDFQSVIDGAVELQMEKERLEIERDKEILAIREQFDPDIKEMQETLGDYVRIAEEFAHENRQMVLKDGNTSETSFAMFGFRLGNPALALWSDKWTWEKVITAIKIRFKKKADQFIRVKEEVDKAAVKNHLDDATRKAIGTKLERKETFFVDPKRDPADPHRLVAQPAK